MCAQYIIYTYMHARPQTHRLIFFLSQGFSEVLAAQELLLKTGLTLNSRDFPASAS